MTSRRYRRIRHDELANFRSLGFLSTFFRFSCFPLMHVVMLVVPIYNEQELHLLGRPPRGP
jgi:hypothetical protein